MIKIILVNFIKKKSIYLIDWIFRGAIHTFRLALWSAHLGGLREEFSNPASQVEGGGVTNWGLREKFFILQEYQELYLSIYL